MKSGSMKGGVSMLFIVLSSFLMKVQAQLPAYQLAISNDTMIDPKTFQFDVYLKGTGSADLELANIGLGIGYDVSTENGGDISFSIVSPIADFSDLLPVQQPSMVRLSNPAQNIKIGEVNYRFMNVLAKGNPGKGGGSHIKNTGNCPSPGSRIGRFRLSNTKNFKKGIPFKLKFNNSPGPGRSNTIISAYVEGRAMLITIAANHLSFDSPGSCLKNF